MNSLFYLYSTLYLFIDLYDLFDFLLLNGEF